MLCGRCSTILSCISALSVSYVQTSTSGVNKQQAHVERSAIRAEEEYQLLEQQHKASGSTSDLPRPPLSLFPRGAAASPDARYIVQSNDAARALLHICVDSLYPGGALPYLPSRYLLWFTYAAIVLLKASRTSKSKLTTGIILRSDVARRTRGDDAPD
jgi:hypothetical protein